MFHPDTDSSRRLVREHQAELARDWGRERPTRPHVAENRRGHGRLRALWLRTQLRPASHTP